MAAGNAATRYLVHSLVRGRGREGMREYFVSWAGYSAQHNSWEPLSNLLADGLGSLVTKFESSRARKRAATDRYCPLQEERRPQRQQQKRKKQRVRAFDAPLGSVIWGKLVNSRYPPWPARVDASRGKVTARGHRAVHVTFYESENVGWVYWHGYAKYTGAANQRLCASDRCWPSICANPPRGPLAAPFQKALCLARAELAATVPDLRKFPAAMTEEDALRVGWTFASAESSLGDNMCRQQRAYLLS